MCVKHCQPCILSGKSVKPIPAPLQPIKWPEQPWEHVQIDIFGEVQIAPQTHKYLVVVYDLHSKWPEIAATGTVTSTAIIRILKDLFTRWGLCRTIQTDNGPQFCSELFSTFLQENGIEHRRSARYAPQTQGGVERFNRVIKEGLKTNLAEGKTFEEAIQTILRTYRSTKHALTGKTPAELMLGRNVKTWIENLAPPKQNIQTPMAVDIAEKQASIKAKVDEKRKAKQPKFKKGDLVRIKKPTQGHKLTSGISRPWMITRQVGSATYELENKTIWNANRLVCAQESHYETPGQSDEENADLFLDIGSYPAEQNEQVNVPNHRPQRQRRPPAYLRDYQV